MNLRNAYSANGMGLAERNPASDAQCGIEIASIAVMKLLLIASLSYLLLE